MTVYTRFQRDLVSLVFQGLHPPHCTLLIAPSSVSLWRLLASGL